MHPGSVPLIGGDDAERSEDRFRERNRLQVLFKRLHLRARK